MRVLLVHAHPDPSSFSGALNGAARDALAAAGHEVECVDLYAEGFDPVMTLSEWTGYESVPANRGPVADHAARVDRAEAIVIVCPIWNFGFPAILKGYFDRVFLPGVSFDLVEGRVRPRLRHVRRLVLVTTYGSPRWWAMVVGDAPRRFVGRVLRALIHPRGRAIHLAHYAISRSTPTSRQDFMDRVARTLSSM